MILKCVLLLLGCLFYLIHIHVWPFIALCQVWSSIGMCITDPVHFPSLCTTFHSFPDAASMTMNMAAVSCVENVGWRGGLCHTSYENRLNMSGVGGRRNSRYELRRKFVYQV